MTSTANFPPGVTLTWFPLVMRSRPPCKTLEQRIAELDELAARSSAGTAYVQATRAAEVCNKAALIASDCGLPELAQALCWSQYQVFAQARPVPVWAAQIAVQPLLNLPRQLIRQGDGDGAHAMLQALFAAARDKTDAVIGGRIVSLRQVSRADDDHQTICTLVWAALLADGTRALAQSGRWHDAARQAAVNRGVGQRLLDGRQATILALIEAGHADRAGEMVAQSIAVQPWDQTVQSLLHVLCQQASGIRSHRDATTMLTSVLDLISESVPGTTVFCTRAGHMALALAEGHDDPRLPQLGAALISSAHSDAYAAREALASRRLQDHMTTGQRRALTALVLAAGLGAGTIPQPLRASLKCASARAEQRLAALLDEQDLDADATTT